jgi:hypothetical protein
MQLDVTAVGCPGLSLAIPPYYYTWAFAQPPSLRLGPSRCSDVHTSLLSDYCLVCRYCNCSCSRDRRVRAAGHACWLCMQSGVQLLPSSPVDHLLPLQQEGHLAVLCHIQHLVTGGESCCMMVPAPDCLATATLLPVLCALTKHTFPISGFWCTRTTTNLNSVRPSIPCSSAYLAGLAQQTGFC